MDASLLLLQYPLFLSVVLESMKRESVQTVGESRKENKAVEKALQKRVNKRYS